MLVIKCVYISGKFKVGVHIADVSWFIEEGSVLDRVASLRATSVYLVHKVLRLFMKYSYRIFPAIRRGFRPSRMTSNNLISPMKFCYNTNSTLPKQSKSSRSVLQDGSRTFGLFWKEKNSIL